MWDHTHNTMLATLRGHTANQYPTTARAHLDAEGRRLITTTGSKGDSTARIWDLETKRQISQIDVHPQHGMIYDIGFSRDGRLAFATADDLYIWEVDSGRRLHVIRPQKGTPEATVRHTYCASFNKDGTEIATAGTSETRVWSVATGEALRLLSADFAACVRFSPDGRYVLTAGYMQEDAEIRDARTGSVVARLTGHEHFVTPIEFSPDGRLVLTSAEDSTARLWAAQTGQVIRVFSDIGGLFSASFTPDGSKVLTQAGGPTYSEPWRGRLWTVNTDLHAMIEDAKARLPRCLTAQQRTAAFLNIEPPSWCIEMGKWPYHTAEWKQWLAGNLAGKNPRLPGTQN